MQPSLTKAFFQNNLIKKKFEQFEKYSIVELKIEQKYNLK